MTGSVLEIGEVVGRLTLLSETRKPGARGRFYNCRCECGREVLAYAGHLKAGSRKTCGCVRPAHRTHGMARTPEYKAWDGARARCTNPKNRKYPLYGGRGITMDPAWLKSFAAFFAEVGLRPSPGHSLDRIDNDRGYEPGNVQWRTATEQNRNRRPMRPRTIGGRRVTSG
jgi:hypothetical protein